MANSSNDLDFVEELQERIEALNSENAMDSGVLDGFFTGMLLNPEQPSFEAVMPYVFDDEGDPAKVPADDRLIELLELRFNQILAALTAGNGLDPIIFPVVDDEGNVIEKGPDVHDTIEPWSVGFLEALSHWDADALEEKMDESLYASLHRILCHIPAEAYKDCFGEDTALYERLRPMEENLQDALYDVVETVFMLKKVYVPNQPVKTTNKIGRNDPCPCGSGKKYKQCCGKK